MPSKGKRELSHQEIWDDSALIQSWDEALEEYKLYHSIHARGERIQDVLIEAERASNKDEQDHISNGEPRDVQQTGEKNAEPTEALEEGEVDEVMGSGEENEAKPDEVCHLNEAASLPVPSQTLAMGKESQTGISDVPAQLAGQVQDEGLKDLMMAWYYAGYYTGLYQGQQQAKQNHPCTKST